MFSQLQQAFKNMIGESNWADPVTQQVTSQKVDAIQAEIGYPKIFETPDNLEKLYEHVRNKLIINYNYIINYNQAVRLMTDYIIFSTLLLFIKLCLLGGNSRRQISSKHVGH